MTVGAYMTEDTPKKRRKPRISVTPRADIAAQDLDAIANNVNERRLRGEHVRNGEIPLREPGKWALRRANSLAEENRHYTMVHELGWLPMTVDDLAPGTTAESIGYRLAEDGKTLCKGLRGDEVLYKKDKQAHDAIKLREARDRQKPLKSESAAKADAASAVASVHGDQAAEYIMKNTTVRISDQQGPVGG